MGLQTFLVEAALDLLSPYQQRVGWDAFHQEDVGADRAPCTDHGVASEDDAVRIDHDIVLDTRMAAQALDDLPLLIFLEAAGTEGDAMVKFYPVADDAGLPDDDAGSMVDEEVGADRGTGMDVDPCAAVGPFGHHAWKKGDILLVEQVRDALDGDRLETGVRQNDLLETARCGIAREGGFDIGLEQGTHGGNSGEKPLGDGRGLSVRVGLLRGFFTDAKADGDRRLKLDCDPVNDLLGRIGKLLGGDGLLGEESREEQVKQIVGERGDRFLGRKVRPVDMVDPAAFPVGIQDGVKQMGARFHPCCFTRKSRGSARTRRDQREFRSFSRFLVTASVRPQTSEQSSLRKGSVMA